MDNEEKLNDALPEEKHSDREATPESSSPNLEESPTAVEFPTESSGTPAPESEVSEADSYTATPSTNSVESAPEHKPNRVNAFLKSKVGICVMAAILILGVLAVVFIKKYNNEKDYEKNLKEFFIESNKSSMASAYICDDLRKIWQEYIFDDKEYFKCSTGTFCTLTDSSDDDEYCSDFSDAVNRKIRWNEEHLSYELTEPYRKARRLYKDMTPAPDKYKEIHTYVKQMFKAMERLYELSENPKGNLSSYSSDCNEAVDEFTSALSDLTNECDIDLTNECDIDFSKSDDD